MTPLVPRLRSLWRNVVRRRQVDAELAEELRAYADELTERKRRAGLDPATARRRALAEMGGMSYVQEQVRSERVGWRLESLVLDLAYAARRMKSSPGFTAAAVLTIALGVGLNVGTFSVLNSVLFGALPVPEADQLVDVRETVDGLAGRNEKGLVNRRFTTAEYRALRDRSETLTGLLGYSVEWPVWLRGQPARQISGRYVSCNYFDVLRQPPPIGRGLVADDCRAGARPVVVLGHRLWTTAFAGDRDVVGRTLTLNRAQVTVVGVASAHTYQPELRRLDYFAPIAIQPLLRPDREWLVSESFGWLSLIGRRGAGRDLAAVQAELDVLAARLDLQQPGRATRILVEPARVTATVGPIVGGPLAAIGRRTGSLRSAAAVIIVAPFGFILLIACANVANLFLARAAARSHEIATRLSLGASRSRVVQQLLTESVLVSLLGGAVGLAVAIWSVEGLTVVLLSPLSVVLPEPRLDGRLLAYAVGLSVATGVLTGLAPALRASGTRLHTTASARASSGSPGAGRLQGVFIGAQVAVCMALLVGAGLLLRVLYEANLAEPGFPAGEVTTVSADLRDFGYVDERLTRFQRRLADGVRALPGVETVAYSPSAPWDRRSTYGSVAVRDEKDRVVPFAIDDVEPDYLATLGIPITLGRSFAAADTTGPRDVVIVSASTARRLWPGRDPIGRALGVGPEAGETATWRVVGVAADAHTVFGPRPPRLLYRPAAPSPPHMLSLLVRSRRPFASLSRDIDGVLEGLDPEVTMRVAPLEANLGDYRYLSVMVSGLAVSLGALALVLAAVGIFGVVSHVVAHRQRELGIRLALGGTSRVVLRAIVRRTLRPVMAGTLIGALGAVAVSSVLAGAVAGLRPVDPVAVGAAAAVLLGVALLASVVPARRGLRADPIRTLQSD